MCNENSHKTIDYILYFERLGTDFHRLMKKYDLNVVLLSRPLNACRSKAKMGTRHMNKQAIRFLNEYHNHDFQYFRYEKVTKGRQ